ncbi:MAG: hypothetical protein J6T14_07690, partial [Clostridia bacterium]|nr:hypothetical protein [Clostridia bacterium]
ALVGACFVIKPTAGIASLPALVGLFSGFAAGTAYTYVRKLSHQGERNALIVFVFSAFTLLVTAPYLIFNYHPMTTQQLVFLLLAGCGGAAASSPLPRHTPTRRPRRYPSSTTPRSCSRPSGDCSPGARYRMPSASWATSSSSAWPCSAGGIT